MKRFTVAVTWIKAEYGGRLHPPFVGMKPTIRFQKHISEWLSCSWDVEIKELEFDETNWTSIVKLQFSPQAKSGVIELKENMLIELLDGYRVIGVGKVID